LFKYKKSRIFLVSEHTLMIPYFIVVPAYLVLGDGVTAEAGGKYRGDGIGELD